MCYNSVIFSGSFHGISGVLDIDIDDYLPDVDANFLDQGIAIQIDYGGRMRLGSWIMAKPGAHTKIGLQQTRTRLRASSDDIQLFPPPCKKDPDMNVIPSTISFLS